jgi:sulfate-transporting ATPase
MTNSELTHSSIARLMRQRTTVNHLLKVLPPATETQPLQQDIEHKLLTYEPGTTIFQKGDVSDNFYLIMQGEVDIMHPFQPDVAISHLTSGQYFGEVGLQQGRKRANTVRANPDSTTEVKVIVIGRETFRQLITADKLFEEEIALTMRHYLSKRLDEFMPDLQRRAKKSDLLDKLTS